ncbi:MAG: hypothetical protein EAZ70_00110 [Runella slithyformis]|nr:MAG: hypothetical protein EAY79_00505 [Runella slithyformis]TAF97606.1 MAG: hypothetical protein EAZ46_01860 [Runella sp.]TAG22514.1 MAG: hypothetical protein EAZ38_05595 [Cytophagales bacterium]TAG41549.1 MAG: hypothetical protein EAZ32_02780 [Cytophagia bacterium]TAF29952.1 MAG: hypothetical protein EAZ70_00110 [Runella slithyformis]
MPLKQQIKTITADSKEFARHQEIAKELNVNFYFAKPYHSWERGANENTNAGPPVRIDSAIFSQRKLI